MNLSKTSVTSSPSNAEEKKDSFIPENSDQKLIRYAYQNELKQIEILLNEKFHNIFEIKDKRFYTCKLKKSVLILKNLCYKI